MVYQVEQEARSVPYLLPALSLLFYILKEMVGNVKHTHNAVYGGGLISWLIRRKNSVLAAFACSASRAESIIFC